MLLTAFTSCGKKQENKLEIAFESNGGTIYYSIRGAANDTVTLPTPEKEGYEFLGWYDNADLGGEPLAESYVITANATLYAKWKACEGVVKFESNGGTSYKDLDFSAQRVELPTPEKEGYIFGGWYTSSDFAGDSLGESFLPTGDVTLYAKWNTVTGSIIFESNGGTEYKKVSTAGQKVQLPTPEKDGFVFAGWYDNADFSGKAYQGEFLPEGAVTLYARWATHFVLITLEENGGLTLEDIRLFDNDNLSLPTPERWGYTFEGWYDNEALTGEPISDYFYYPTEDITLYAKWEKCSYLYLFYGETKMEYVRFEYPVGKLLTLNELYGLLEPEDITVTDFMGDRHVLPFQHWAYQGEDETSHIKVTSDIKLDGEFLILVAQYDDSEVPPAEHLTYDKETGVYTTTGKVAHQFIDAPKQVPYVYSLDISFRKGTAVSVGPAFRMRVSDANYHYEGGCDYLSPTISTSNGSMYIASVLSGSWSTFVSTISLSELPESWQSKFNSVKDGGLMSVTISIADYGTYFEVYIDNALAYTYTNSTKLASYPYTGLGVRSPGANMMLSGARVSYGYEVSYSSGVDGLTAEPTTWMCGTVELPTWRRDNYAVSGWYYDAEFTQPVDDRSFNPQGNVTLYAKWSTDYHVITFDACGGSACESYNYSAGKLPLPTTTTRMNYIFTGWYYDKALTKKVDPYSVDITGDTTLYAGWRLPYSHIVANSDGSYTYSTKTEAVLGTMDSGIPAEGTYHEFSQTITMTKGVASAGLAFRMNMNRDYTYETAGTDYLSIQFAGNCFRVSYVKDGKWARLLPSNSDYVYDKMPQVWKDKYNSTADGGKITVTLTVRDYGSYFEAYIDGVLAYTYGQNGETMDLTQFTGNGWGIRCSAGSTVIFDDVTAKAVTIN